MRARLKQATRSDEDGVTIIEVLVAALVLVLGALAVFMTFTAAIRNVQRSKEMQQGVSVAQREMERLRIEPYATLAMKGNPGPSSEPNNPRGRIVGDEFETDRQTGGEPLELALLPAGSERKVGVTPESRGLASPDGTKVDVFRFVLCEPQEGNACRAKRLVVDVVPTPAANEHGYEHSYYELQSTVVDPG